MTDIMTETKFDIAAKFGGEWNLGPEPAYLCTVRPDSQYGLMEFNLRDGIVKWAYETFGVTTPEELALEAAKTSLRDVSLRQMPNWDWGWAADETRKSWSEKAAPKPLSVGRGGQQEAKAYVQNLLLGTAPKARHEHAQHSDVTDASPEVLAQCRAIPDTAREIMLTKILRIDNVGQWQDFRTMFVGYVRSYDRRQRELMENEGTLSGSAGRSAEESADAAARAGAKVMTDAAAKEFGYTGDEGEPEGKPETKAQTKAREAAETEAAAAAEGEVSTS